MQAHLKIWWDNKISEKILLKKNWQFLWLSGPRKSSSRSESARPGSSPAKEKEPKDKDKTDAKEAKTTAGDPSTLLASRLAFCLKIATHPPVINTSVNPKCKKGANLTTFNSLFSLKGVISVNYCQIVIFCTCTDIGHRRSWNIHFKNWGKVDPSLSQ